MDIELTTGRSRPSFGEWLLGRIFGIFDYDTLFWRVAGIGPWAALMAMLVTAALGMPTGLGIPFDCVAAVLLGTVGLAAGAVSAAFLLSLCHVPLPRLYVGSVLCTGAAIYTIWQFADAGITSALLLAGILTSAGVLAGLTIGLLASRRASARAKLSFAAAVAVLFCAAAYGPWNGSTAVPASAVLADGVPFVVPELAADNPADPGPFAYTSFTYGSGSDLHRDEFAGDAALVSEPADASAYIRHWPWLKSFFWGFDQKRLPLNGRVWMPEGTGPFPLVLMVHGNHLMERFSDGGYDYLGRLLASRGFIAVSVDENFLNYSVWSGIPDQDMKVRAWVLLKHLQQIAAFDGQPGNPFYNRVDLQKVALIGHSRGGQAVAMAADRSRWFDDDKSLAGLDDIRIQAVVGIAPTDKAVDKTSARLSGVDYLTLQGASDGDVDTFNGERQYIRTSIAPGSDRFKAALYIAEANHSRFNTDWGVMDDSLPGGLLLNRKGMMPADDQREVAKVYVSAFLETALHGNSDYRGLFADYRAGAAWLPNAHYTNRYEDGSFRGLADFDDDTSKTTFKAGVTASAVGLDWSEAAAEDRDGNGKGTRGAVLEWKAGGGSYTLSLKNGHGPTVGVPAGEASELTFAMTDLERDLHAEDSDGDGERSIPAPGMIVELVSGNGERASLPLDRFMPIARPPVTVFTIAPWLEKRIKDGKYKEASEPVFQTYRLPLERFADANPRFDPGDVRSVTFRPVGDRGKIMLDDIGFDRALPK